MLSRPHPRHWHARVPRILTALSILAVLGYVSPAAGQADGQGRAVLVTGASSGIGLQMTEALSGHQGLR